MRKNQIRQTRFRGKPQPPKSANYLTVTPDGETQTGGLSFARNSEATVTLPDGSIETLGVNEPGLSNGLQMRAATTNLLLWSEDFSNSAWGNSRIVVTPSAIVAPDGSLTGTKIVANTETVQHISAQFLTGIAQNTPYTLTIYAKAGEISVLGVQLATWTPGYPTATFNLADGTVGTSANGQLSMTPVGNGWYRCTFAGVSSGSGSTQPKFVLLVSNSMVNLTYAGDGISGLYVWGAQLEAGSVAADYVKSEGTQGVRAAETATIQLPGLRENLLTHSEAFDNSDSWGKGTGVSIVPNASIAPDGTQTADQISSDNPSTVNFIGQPFTADGGGYMASLYVKAGTASQMTLRIWDNDLNAELARNNFTPTGDWQRIVCNTSSTTAGHTLRVLIYPATFNLGSVGSVYIWGAQLVHGWTQPLDYTPTTDAAINVPSWLSTEEGSVALTVTPTWTGATPSSDQKWFISANAGNSARLLYIVGSNPSMWAYDGTHQPSVLGSFVAGQPSRFACRWSVSGGWIRIDNLTTGTKGATSPFTGFGSFDPVIRIGSDNTAQQQPNALISDIVFSADPEGAR